MPNTLVNRFSHLTIFAAPTYTTHIPTYTKHFIYGGNKTFVLPSVIHLRILSIQLIQINETHIICRSKDTFLVFLVFLSVPFSQNSLQPYLLDGVILQLHCILFSFSLDCIFFTANNSQWVLDLIVPVPILAERGLNTGRSLSINGQKLKKLIQNCSLFGFPIDYWVHDFSSHLTYISTYCMACSHYT